MSGDLERMNAAEKEIIGIEDTLYQLNLLLDTSKSNAIKKSNLTSIITDGSVAVLGEYDITPYATDPLHEKKVETILSKMPVMDSEEKIDTYIKKKYRSSPVTGEMVMSARDAYNVDARLMMAIMEQDSRFGTAGVAVRTLNPGNVGNTDDGSTRTYDSWQAGVTAVAEWLSRNRVTQNEKDTELTEDGSVAVFGEYDIASYATDSLHEKKVETILSNMPSMETVEKVNTYITGKYVNSPVTGQMVLHAAQIYDVDTRLMMALMEQDSRFGTEGLAVRTLNPGNMGNDSDGNTRTYASWQDGVTAVAEWLNRHRTSGEVLEVDNEISYIFTPATDIVETDEDTSDLEAPVITVFGNNPAHIEVGSTYVDLGASVADNVNNNLGIQTFVDGVEVTSVDIDTSAERSYIITYKATDQAGNMGEATRTVIVGEDITEPVVVDTTPPVITLIGSAVVSIEQGTPYADQGATAEDDTDGDITANIVTANLVDTTTVGEYSVTYNATDHAGNAATEVTRTVTVTEPVVVDTTPPVITLIGSAVVSIEQGTPYADQGATAEDDTDGDITANIVTANLVDTTTVGEYSVTYNATDHAGNAATEVTRTVTVTEPVVVDDPVDTTVVTEAVAE